jgi:hypothetical protein
MRVAYLAAERQKRYFILASLDRLSQPLRFLLKTLSWQYFVDTTRNFQQFAQLATLILHFGN